jgi:hypothetical protein
MDIVYQFYIFSSDFCLSGFYRLHIDCIIGVSVEDGRRKVILACFKRQTPISLEIMRKTTATG